MAEKNIGFDGVVEELRSIKKLLVLNLLKDGFTQKQIGAALGIDQSAVSRLVPGAALKAKKGKGR